MADARPFRQSLDERLLDRLLRRVRRRVALPDHCAHRVGSPQPRLVAPLAVDIPGDGPDSLAVEGRQVPDPVRQPLGPLHDRTVQTFAPVVHRPTSDTGEFDALEAIGQLPAGRMARIVVLPRRYCPCGARMALPIDRAHPRSHCAACRALGRPLDLAEER